MATRTTFKIGETVRRLVDAAAGFNLKGGDKGFVGGDKGFVGVITSIIGCGRFLRFNQESSGWYAYEFEIVDEPVAAKGTPQVSAITALETAITTLQDRAKSRDAADGERSMAKTVDIFKAVTGVKLTETQGWQFMLALKQARASQGGFHFDDYVDLVGYSALLAEAAAGAQLAK